MSIKLAGFINMEITKPVFQIQLDKYTALSFLVWFFFGGGSVFFLFKKSAQNAV